MEAKKFKTMFGGIAAHHGFYTGGGGWHRELLMGLFVLDLQKSNFGQYFELNLKLFLQKKAPREAASLKKLTKSMSGDIFRRQPEQYRAAFDLESGISVVEREKLLARLFDEIIEQIAAGASSPSGLLGLRDQGVIFLMPNVEALLKAG